MGIGVGAELGKNVVGFCVGICVGLFVGINVGFCIGICEGNEGIGWADGMYNCAGEGSRTGCSVLDCCDTADLSGDGITVGSFIYV